MIQLYDSEEDPVDQELLDEIENDGSLDKIKEIVAKGADVNTKNEDGKTPLSLAAEKGRNDIIRYLHETKDAGINELDEVGQTPLIWAAAYGQTETIKYLESKGADINQESFYGHTVRPRLTRKMGSENFQNRIRRGPTIHSKAEIVKRVMK